jgi:RNA polymerase primary sigma factor
MLMLCYDRVCYPSTVTAFLDISGRYALLTKNEEIQLGRRVQRWLQWDEEQQGPCPPSVVRSGQRARERFVLCNLRLVTRVARSYSRRLTGTSLTFEDLLQEGVIGLARAAEKYDPNCGYAMSTYATWWIRQAISRAFDLKSSVIKVSSNPRRHLFKLQREMAGGVPLAAAAERLGLTERQVDLAMRAHAGIRTASLDAALEAGYQV